MDKQYYNKYNFHKYTFCEFKEFPFKEIENLQVSYKSKSGSSYYFTEKGVYRLSNHWGRASNCRWRLKSNIIASASSSESSSLKVNNSTAKIGYANWSDFYPNNEQEKLFYIEVNWVTNEVNFQHKRNLNYNEEYVLRNALATAKRIQTIKEVLTENKWPKYLNFVDLKVLREEVVEKLIKTEETFIKIKQRYL